MRFLKILLFTLSFAVLTSAQVLSDGQTTATEWTKVRSGGGDFIIEVPTENKHFKNKDGFSIGRSGGDPFVLSDMNMVNAYVDGTLVSVESYYAFEGALDAMYERDTLRKTDMEISKTKASGYTLRQVTVKNDQFYMVRRYFNSKNQIYILTAAARTGETPAMRRFLDSVQFTPGKKIDQSDKITPMSSLPHLEPGVEIVEDKVSVKPADGSKIEDAQIKKFVIVHKQAPSYTKTARKKGVSGNIKIRAKFNADGWVSNLTLAEKLDGGLLRQTLFATIRIKFLPQETGGKLVDVSRTIEYSFMTY